MSVAGGCIAVGGLYLLTAVAYAVFSVVVSRSEWCLFSPAYVLFGASMAWMGVAMMFSHNVAGLAELVFLEVLNVRSYRSQVRREVGGAGQ